MITLSKSANSTVSRSDTIIITTGIISYSDLKRNEKNGSFYRILCPMFNCFVSVGFLCCAAALLQ